MNSMNILKRVLLLCAFIVLTSITQGGSAIPSDNLSYPVLVNIEGQGFASGFYFRDGIHLYFVTAKHVLFTKDKDTLKGRNATCLSYSADPNSLERNLIKLELEVFEKNKLIRSHKIYDVSIVRIGNIKKSEISDSEHEIIFAEGVQILENAKLVGAEIEHLWTYKQVLVSNDIFVFGYPTSIGIKESEQIDYLRPLLRKGIVAGKNRKTKTLILDCPIYPGNSGGPVVQVERIDLTRRKFYVIGVVTDFVPFTEIWVNTTHRFTNLEISNSGYSIAAPMDAVLDLLWKSEE